MSAPAVSPMGALTGVEPPPLRLPGGHFATGVVFLVLGGVGLTLVAQELAAGAYLSPRVAGVTHLFTLGWITTSIFGALYQLLPVALGQPVRWQGLARLTFWLYVPGLAVFAGSLVALRPDVMVWGAAVFGTGVLLFCVNLAATLKRAAKRDVTWWALTGACAYLFLTLVVGLALAANLRWPFMGTARLVALGTHLHVALVGWVLLVMVGVAHRLLPMFLLSHGATEKPGKWAVGLLAAGAGLLFALHHNPWPALARGVPTALIAAGLGAFLLQARAFYATSKRPELDPGMRLAASALVVLAAAGVMGVGLTGAGFGRPRMATAYVLLLVLGISLFVAAHYYKIVPFLVWYHRFGPLAGKQKVPRVSELYSARWATVAGALLVGGVLALALGVALGSGGVVRGGGVLFTAGAAVEAVQMAALSRRRPT